MSVGRKVNIRRRGKAGRDQALAAACACAEQKFASSNKKFSIAGLLGPVNYTTTMPAATITKSAKAGTKRKSDTIKEVHVKETKKAKFDPPGKSKAAPMKNEKKTKAVKVVTSDSDSDDAGSDGGVPLDSRALEELEEEDNSETLPKIIDGVHPDRAKAANSKISVNLPQSSY